MADGDLVAVAIVGKPHGLRGEVYVRTDPDFPAPVVAGRTFSSDGHGALVVADVREHSGRLLVRFEGVDDRTAAEGMRGERLLLPRADVEVDEEAVWVEDLLGLDVVTEDGELVGVVEAVADGAAHDYLVVARPDGGEVLIPAVEELVELADDRVVVRPLPGLLG